MSTPYPTPSLDGAAAAFWHAVRDGRLAIEACATCGALRHPPRPVCAHCSSTATTWTTVSGRGVVWSHTTVHPPTLPAFAGLVPYHAYVVRLAEGPFLVTRAAPGCDERFDVDTEVEFVFETVATDVVLPLIRRHGS
jgi:uncharacterized OB-fold protein